MSARRTAGRVAQHRRPTVAEVREAAESHPILGQPLNTYQVVSLLHYPDTVPLDVHEDRFQSAIIKMANALGLLVYHTRISDGSTRGFPDLVIVGWGGIALWELKREDGRIEPDQRVWNFALDRIARLSFGLIQVAIYRPSDWGIDGPVCKGLERLARPPKVLRLIDRMRRAGIDTSDLAA